MPLIYSFKLSVATFFPKSIEIYSKLNKDSSYKKNDKNKFFFKSSTWKGRTGGRIGRRPAVTACLGSHGVAGKQLL